MQMEITAWVRDGRWSTDEGMDDPNEENTLSTEGPMA